jgi:hypothetical protein
VVAVLGGVSTILASYLAKVRGSGEPEFSSVRSRELSSYLREVHAFIIDDGSFPLYSRGERFGFLSPESFCTRAGEKPGIQYSETIAMYRERFEMIIKTDGEGSGSGQYSRRQSVSDPNASTPLPTHVSRGHPGVLPGRSGPCARVMDEKQQMWRNEKATGGIV